MVFRRSDAVNHECIAQTFAHKILVDINAQFGHARKNCPATHPAQGQPAHHRIGFHQLHNEPAVLQMLIIPNRPIRSA